MALTTPSPDQEICATERGRDGAIRDRQIERRRPQIADTRITSGYRYYVVRDARDDELANRTENTENADNDEDRTTAR